MAERREESGIPTGRLARGATFGGLVAEQAARYAGLAVANLGRDHARRQLAIEQRHLDAADQMLRVLGTMKGPAMKLGQVLSFVDLGILPEDVRPRFQERLATLCVEAPPIAWQRMEPVVVSMLGGPISQFFSTFDTVPIAAASIGQVYRGTTREGVDVAVKVQYPEMKAAAAADAKNLSVLLRVARSVAPSFDTVKLGRELKQRLLEELDYGLEARNTQMMAQVYRGHPFIRVPEPILPLCRPTVLVTEYLEGDSFEDACGQDTPSRNRVGEAIARFYLGSMCRLAMFSGDPHPGNIRILEDGRVALLDFGSFRQLDERLTMTLRDLLAPALRGETARLIATVEDCDVLARTEGLEPLVVEALLDDIFGWFVADQVVTVDSQMASNAIVYGLSRTAPYAELLDGQDLPVEWTMMARTLVTTSALLGQLRASANWNRIAREWVCDEAPSTPLGVQEAAFFKRPTH